jgi:hypothetical protein
VKITLNTRSKYLRPRSVGFRAISAFCAYGKGYWRFALVAWALAASIRSRAFFRIHIPIRWSADRVAWL